MPFWKRKSLVDLLQETKSVKIRGVVFKIKKLDVMSHLEGFKVMTKLFDTYKTKGAGVDDLDVANLKKVKECMRDIIVAAVVHPKIVLKAGDDMGIPVDDVMKDMGLVQDLVAAVMAYTYKKK